MQITTNELTAEFFYRKPLEIGEPKPVFGLAPSDPDRPDQEAHLKTVKNARGQGHCLSEAGFVLLEHDTVVSDFYDDDHVAEIYYPEMQALAQQETGADKVFVMSHITRNEAEAALGKRLGRWGSGWAAADQAEAASPPACPSRRPEPRQRLVSRACRDDFWRCGACLSRTSWRGTPTPCPLLRS